MVGKDSCDWCSRMTPCIQRKPGKDFGLCLECCPDFDAGELVWIAGYTDGDIPDLPSEWNFMGRDEKKAYLDGMSIEDIMDEFDWHSPP